MSLIKCPECGRSISDKAVKCPGCGISKQEMQDILRASLSEHDVREHLIVEEDSIKEDYEKTSLNNIEDENGKDIIIGVVLAITAVLIIIMIIVMWGYFKENEIFRKIYNKTGICISHEYLDASCTTPKHCDICDKTIGEVLGHSYSISATMDSTCNIPGKIEYTCMRCGDIYYDMLEALGHIYTDNLQVIDASCTECGSRTYNCKRCGEIVVEEIPVLEHVWTDATCTTPMICERCYEVEGNSLGHTTVNGICDRCGEFVVEPIEFSGSGDTVLKNVNIPGGMCKIYFTNEGASNFIIHAYSSDGQSRSWMNEIGDFNGYILSKEPIIDGMIEVKSSGSWSISVMQIEEGGTSNIKGHGMCVSPYFELQDAPLIVHMTNTNGKSNFIVRMYDENGRRTSLSNEIGEYEGEKVLNKVSAGKKYCIFVDSDGDWVIDFGLGDKVTTVSNIY